MRRLLLLAGSVLISCSTNPPGAGSLRVVVDFEPGVQSTCVKLVARGSSDRESMPVPITGRATLVFGVAQNGEASAVDVQALGFSDETCTTRTVPEEASEVRTTQYGAPTPEERLTLRRVGASNGTDGGTDGGSDGGVDGDGDGYTSDVDCNDANVAIHPNAAEQCGNQLDDDCDTFTDCSDSACDLQQCRVGAGNRCVQGACAEVDCGDSADNDFDGTTDCADVDCAGAACGAGGTCVGAMCRAPTETGLCADGADNDQDQLVDCADPDCPSGATCSDGDPCTASDVCNTGACSPGGALTCTMAPGACFASTGACQADAGGCVYPVNTSNVCDDGLACTLNTCVADGGCEAVARLCNAPPAGGCFAASGTCAELDGGTCSYTPLAQGTLNACTDNDNCTVGDACDGDGGCTAGLRTMCTLPGECFSANGCDVSGACQFSVRSGSCTGGVCASDGGCVPQTIFTYTPSNFTELDLPASAGAMTINCATTFTTLTADGGTDWNTCGIGPAAPPVRLLDVGGTSTALFFVDSLTANASFRAVGGRPVIIAVRNDVTLNSTVNVSTDSTATGAGANAGCLPLERGGDGDASGNPETGGGGGGGAFGSNGGSGAAGTGGGARGDAGVVANTNLTLTPLRGGCRGGSGGRNGANGGSGGRPGGAVQLSAGGAITLNTGGSVQANGQGGLGGVAGQRVAGGGGGSGGAILLEGASLTLNALGALAANGGAGGEGSGGSLGGATGQNGQVSGAQAQCFATASGCGGNGGDGAARAGGAGNGAGPSGVGCASNPPGGGGGGGAGRVRLNFTSCSFDGTSVVSPPSTSGTPGCVR